MMRFAHPLALAVALIFLAGPASAHTGHNAGFALIDGFLHPLMGLDHLLAMVAVGLLAWQLGGRAVLSLPAAFLGSMALGAAASHWGYEMLGIEFLITTSVIVVGLAVALDVRSPVLASAAVIGLFAYAHGQAHGVEIPLGAGFYAYSTGFIVATGLLHAFGLGMGSLMPRGAVAVRTAGTIIALAGAGLAVT